MNKAEKYHQIANEANKSLYNDIDYIHVEIRLKSNRGHYQLIIPHGSMKVETQKKLLKEGFRIESNKNDNTTTISWY